MTGPLAHFDELMRASLDAELTQISKAVNAVVGTMVARNMLNSTARYLATGEAVSEGIGRLRLTIHEKWDEYMKPRLATLADADRGKYIEAAAKAFDLGAARLRGALNLRPDGGMEQVGLAVISAAIDRERTHLAAALNLYATLPTPSPISNVNVTTHGNNSPVIMGSGSLSQSVSSTTVNMSDLAIALGELLAAIDRTGVFPDLRQVVEEAKKEAEKQPQPNRIRLKGFLSAAKDIVQTSSALKPAWDSVASIAERIGGLFL